MCFEGNNAPLSATYLASQLVALHKNAAECAADHPGDISFASAEYAKSKYTRALAQYHHFDPKVPEEHLGVDDLPFAATFDAPDLQFVCNHEAVLFLNLNGGHLRLAHPSSQINGHGPQIGNRTFQKVHAAFRVQFVRTDVKGVDSKIGNDDTTHYIHMVVLRFETAKLVDLKFDKSLGIEYLESMASYLHSYLAFLHAAGNHVLFDIPDFAAQGQTGWKDYALLKNHIDPDVYCKDISLFGITTKAINDYLETQWTTAVSKARAAGDYLMASISEISSNWLANAAVDDHFFIRFGAPKVKPLCPHEVILYFDVEDIAFFDNANFESAKPLAVYHNWTIAFVVNVIEVDSNASVLKLDFTTARFSSFFSSYSKVDTTVVAYFNAIVKFFTIDYLDILLLYGYNIIYQATFSVLGRDTSDTGYWKRVDRVDHSRSLRRHGQVLIWLERIRELSLSGADQVLALSEDSINRILYSRWHSAGASSILSTWTRDSLKLSFNPFTIRLLSNGKAILYVDIAHGENNLKVVQQQQSTAPVRAEAFWLSSFWGLEIKNDVVITATPYSFEGVTVAYEVDLALVPFDKLEIEESVFRDLYNSVITVKEKQQYVVQNLLLNLRTAKYLPNLSSVGNLGTGKEGLARLETLRTSLGEYLSEVSRSGYGIIQTIPTLLANDSDPFAFTDVNFKVLTKDTVTIEQYIDADEVRSIVDTPVLVIYGVSTQRPIPPFLSKWSVGWLPSGVAKNTVGTVWFSKETFLERRLLALLEGFNARTTILPSFAGVMNGVWKYDLTTWAASKYHGGRGERCAWTEVVGSNPRYLEYVWEHRDGWNHETEGSTFTEGEYSLSCHTENRLLIPTEYKPHRNLEITVAGKSIVEISSFTQNERWSRQTVSSWSATISITSSQTGLRVEMTSRINPAVVEGHDTNTAYFPFDVEAIHRDTLPDKLTTLHEILPTLKDALEGSWAYASLGTQKVGFVHPVFTRRGDFVLELYPHEQAAGIVARVETPQRVRPVVVQPQYITTQTQSQGRTVVQETTIVRTQTPQPATVTRMTVPVNAVPTPPAVASASYSDESIFAPRVYSAVAPTKAVSTPTPPQAYRARSFYTNGDYGTSSYPHLA